MLGGLVGGYGGFLGFEFGMQPLGRHSDAVGHIAQDGDGVRNVGDRWIQRNRFGEDLLELEELGALLLIDGVVQRACEAEDYVRKYAGTIADNAPLTVDAVKFTVGEALKSASKRDLERCIRLVNE